MLVPVKRFRMQDGDEDFQAEIIFLPIWQTLRPAEIPRQTGHESEEELRANLVLHNGRSLFFAARRFLEQLDRYRHTAVAIPETRAMLEVARDEIERRLAGGLRTIDLD